MKLSMSYLELWGDEAVYDIYGTMGDEAVYDIPGTLGG